jgi:hypothetical protein
MLKKEEESAWFSENGLSDFVETRVEIPDAPINSLVSKPKKEKA